jgi:hypothetical protein
VKNLLLVLLAVLVLSAVARADTITIFNTGVDNSNALLAAGSVDPHYLLNGGKAFVGTSINPSWIANGPNSQWITPTTDASDNVAPGTYTYTTTFSLPVGFTDAMLSGQWATDNSGAMSLNGGPTVSTTPDAGFTAFTPFTIASGFVPGTNTITFSVLNSTTEASPSGLRVEISGFFTPIPEPSTSMTALLGSGLMALGVFGSRLRKLP